MTRRTILKGLMAAIAVCASACNYATRREPSALGRYGHCRRVWMQYPNLQTHNIWFTKNHATFVVCEDCWHRDDLTLALLTRYYDEMFTWDISQGWPSRYPSLTTHELHDIIAKEYALRGNRS